SSLAGRARLALDRISGSLARRIPGRTPGCSCRAPRRRRKWQEHAEFRAAFLAIGKFHGSIVQLEGAESQRQSNARATLARGEVQVEDFLLNFGRDPRSLIGY